MNSFRGGLVGAVAAAAMFLPLGAWAAAPAKPPKTETSQQVRADVFQSIVGFIESSRPMPRGNFETDAEYNARLKGQSGGVSRQFNFSFEPRSLSLSSKTDSPDQFNFGYSPDLAAFYVSLPKSDKVTIDIISSTSGTYRAQNAYGAEATVESRTAIFNEILFTPSIFDRMRQENLVSVVREGASWRPVGACDMEKYFLNQCESVILFPVDREVAIRSYDGMIFEIQINVVGEDASLKSSVDWTTPTISEPRRTTFLARTIYAEPIGITLKDRSTGREVGKYQIGDRTVRGSITVDDMLFEPPVIKPEFTTPKSLKRAGISGFVTVEMNIADGLDRVVLDRFGIPTTASVVDSGCRKIGSDDPIAPCNNTDFALKYAMTLRFKLRKAYGLPDRGPVVRYRIEF